MANYTLIAPSIAEQQTRGFLIGAEKSYRKHLYRIELFASGFSLLCDGEKIRSWDDLPKSVVIIAHDIKRIYEETRALAA